MEEYIPPVIYVVNLMTADSKVPYSGTSSRPHWFTKEAVFRSVYENRDALTIFLIVFDGDPSNHWIKKYPVELFKINAGEGNQAFRTMTEVIKFLPAKETDIVYILEDDYVHRPNWPSILREGLRTVEPKHIKFDYITLYDHRDKYYFNGKDLEEMYKDLQSQIAISASVHWRTIPATTNTFALTHKTFFEDFEIIQKYMLDDLNKFRTLQKKGRILGSCIPGYSTHCQISFLSPCIDWENEITQYKGDSKL